MVKKILFGLLGGVLLLLAIIFIIPGRQPDPNLRLPWKIEVDANGNHSVFDLMLGKSTLADARNILGDEGEINLFIGQDNKRTLEAYFRRIYLSGLRADFILTLGLNETILNGIYERGVRLSALDSGAKKVNLASRDMALALAAPVIHITYLPSADLDEKLVRNRFGEPEQHIQEQSGITHWLYPEKGLDIAINQEGGEVLQYTTPVNFELITDPLKKKAQK